MKITKFELWFSIFIETAIFFPSFYLLCSMFNAIRDGSLQKWMYFIAAPIFVIMFSLYVFFVSCDVMKYVESNIESKIDDRIKVFIETEIHRRGK